MSSKNANRPPMTLFEFIDKNVAGLVWTVIIVLLVVGGIVESMYS